MQLAEINYKPSGGQSLRDIIDCVIGAQLYPPPGPEHYKLLCLDRLHASTHHQAT